MENLKFSVILCSYNRLSCLKKCIDSLINQDYAKNLYEIIIVNDGSADNTGKYIKECAANYPSLLSCAEQPHNGPGAGRNKGALMAQGGILVFLDDDCEAPKEWLRNIESVFQNHPEIAGLGSHTLLKFEEGLLDKRKYWGGKADEDYMPLEFAPQKWLSTHNFAIKKDAFGKVNGFDSNMQYIDEDLDLMYRLLKAGYKLLRTDKTVVYHYARSTIKGIFKQLYSFGKSDAGIFSCHFPNQFVMDFYIGRFLNLKEFFYIKRFPINVYIRIDFFKLFLLSLLFVHHSIFVPIGYLFLVWLAILLKEKSFFMSFKLFIALLTRDAAYMLGHIAGGIKHKVIYI